LGFLGGFFNKTYAEAFHRHIFSYVKIIPNQFYIIEKYVTYVINTKLNTCFDIARTDYTRSLQ